MARQRTETLVDVRQLGDELARECSKLAKTMHRLTQHIAHLERMAEAVSQRGNEALGLCGTPYEQNCVLRPHGQIERGAA